MQAQSLIQIRVDRPLKEEVSEIFSSLGLDMSTAVRMFFQRCRLEKGIPFSLTLGRDGAETPRARIGIAKGRWRFRRCEQRNVGICSGRCVTDRLDPDRTRWPDEEQHHVVRRCGGRHVRGVHPDGFLHTPDGERACCR